MKQETFNVINLSRKYNDFIQAMSDNYSINHLPNEHFSVYYIRGVKVVPEIVPGEKRDNHSVTLIGTPRKIKKTRSKLEKDTGFTLLEPEGEEK